MKKYFLSGFLVLGILVVSSVVFSAYDNKKNLYKYDPVIQSGLGGTNKIPLEYSQSNPVSAEHFTAILNTVRVLVKDCQGKVFGGFKSDGSPICLSVPTMAIDCVGEGQIVVRRSGIWNCEFYSGALPVNCPLGAVLQWQGNANGWKCGPKIPVGNCAANQVLTYQNDSFECIDASFSFVEETCPAGKIVVGVTQQNGVYRIVCEECSGRCTGGTTSGTGSCLESSRPGGVATNYFFSMGVPASESQLWSYNVNAVSASVCQFKCINNSTWNGSACMTATAPSTCTGMVPANATICLGDDMGLSVSLSRVAVDTCSVAKCEYKCDQNYFVGANGSCIFCNVSAGSIWNSATKVCTTPFVPLTLNMRCRDGRYIEHAIASGALGGLVWKDVLDCKSLHADSICKGNPCTTIFGNGGEYFCNPSLANNEGPSCTMDHCDRMGDKKCRANVGAASGVYTCTQVSLGNGVSGKQWVLSQTCSGTDDCQEILTNGNQNARCVSNPGCISRQRVCGGLGGTPYGILECHSSGMFYDGPKYDIAPALIACVDTGVGTTLGAQPFPNSYRNPQCFPGTKLCQSDGVTLTSCESFFYRWAGSTTTCATGCVNVHFDFLSQNLRPNYHKTGYCK